MSEPVVLHICLSAGWGGLEMYPVRVGSRLSQAGYQIFGLCLDKTPVNQLMKQSGIQVFSAKSKGHLLSLDLYGLVQWVKRKNITVVHCHKSGDLLVARLIRFFYPVQVVFTEHMGSRRAKKDLYHRWVYSCVDLVLSVSRETYQRNIHSLPVPVKMINQLWLGTDIPEKNISESHQIAEIKQSFSIPSSHKVLGAIGRICDGKGYIELIRAFCVVQKQYPDMSLVIAGGIQSHEGCDLSYYQYLKQVIAELGLGSKVIFTGFVNDVQRFLSMVDIVCLPYANEAFGLTAIEAMAAQKPIVGANTGALPEIFADTALLCDPLDSEDIARKIEIFIAETALAAEMGHKARQRAIGEFSMDTHIQKLFGFYTELLNESVVLPCRT